MDKNIAIIILAAGRGDRFNYILPKQFFKFKNKPVLYYSVQAFLKFLKNKSGRVLIVAPKKHLSRMHKLIKHYFPLDMHRIDVTPGGPERVNSYFNGIDYVFKNYKNIDVVAVHDGVRPLITPLDINEQYIHFLKKNMDICFIEKPLQESVFYREKKVFKCINQDRLVSSQTPFFYKVNILKYFLPKYKSMMKNNLALHPHFHILELLPKKTNNIIIDSFDMVNPNTKLTTPDDIFTIKRLIGKRA